MPVDLSTEHATNRAATRQAVIDALCMRGGVHVPDAHPRAKALLNHQFTDLVGEFIEAQPVSLHMLGVDGRRAGGHDILKFGFSQRTRAKFLGESLAATIEDFSFVLSEAIEKAVHLSYHARPSTWSVWASQRLVRDFKSITGASLIAQAMNEVKEGAEYKDAKSETGQTYNLVKYGRSIKITWEAMLRDDIETIIMGPAGFGAAARAIEDEHVYATVFAANSGAGQTMGEDSLSLFASGHANVGTTSTLTAASLGADAGKMAAQTRRGSDSRANLYARYILTGSEVGETARALAATGADPHDDDDPSRRVAVVAPQLDTIDANAWWLVADREQVRAAEVAFLANEPEPRVIEVPTGFATDTRQFVIRHSVGAAALDWRAFTKNAGGS